MVGQGEFTKLTKKWQQFVNNELFKEIIKEFPYGSKITNKAVATLLVNNSWIEKVQLYTWRSARASGWDISFEDFKKHVVDQVYGYKTVDGVRVDIKNGWKNSYESKIAQKFVNAIKNGSFSLQDRVKKLESGKADLSYVESVFKTVPKDSEGYKTINANLKQLKSMGETMSEYDFNKIKKEIEVYVATNIKEVQYGMLVKQKTDTVLNYQGKRLAQDQLQRANNNMLLEDGTKKENSIGGNPDLILVGYWTLSPTHTHHYYPGGDPCERHANHDAGYGKGSYVGDIPVPIIDSHYACKCKVSLKVMEKK
jgi:hypothetical protein